MISVLAGLFATHGIAIAGYAATAAAAVGAALWAMANARTAGKNSQRLADSDARENDRAKSDKAADGVAGLSDRRVSDELHRDFNRKP